MADHHEGSTIKLWINLQTSQQLLQMHSGAYPNKLHHSVVREQHHSGHLQHSGQEKGTQYHQGPHPPPAHTVHTPAVWQTLQECKSRDRHWHEHTVLTEFEQ